MCWGTQHGWKDAVKLAKDPDPTGRNRLRSAVDDAWRAAFVGQRNATRRPSNKISYPKKIAGIDSGIADLVDWLAQDLAARKYDAAQRVDRVPGQGVELSAQEMGVQQTRRSAAASSNESDSAAVNTSFLPLVSRPSPEDSSRGPDPSADEPTVIQVEKLGDALAGQVLKDVERAYPGPVPSAVKVALADHFWCDLLAQLAYVVDSGIKVFDQVPDRVAQLILKSRKDAGRLPLEELVVKTAVKSVWKYIHGLAIFGWIIPARTFLPVVRTLAVLICKAPERHRAVVQHCLDPMAGELTSETKQRLIKVLREWLPQTERGLEPAIASAFG
ncbi:hypothetical protein [Kibdelosporangium persicum]|uniref:hypothetical protein n=1 Tax=Kibdelosporangium persicum TaxID=2698649 RepID=UPI0015650B53|nr:hypothetical protein [Kibdelosporangium persicum]